MFDGPEFVKKLEAGNLLAETIRLVLGVAIRVEDVSDEEQAAFDSLLTFAQELDTQMMVSALDRMRTIADEMEGWQ